MNFPEIILTTILAIAFMYRLFSSHCPLWTSGRCQGKSNHPKQDFISDNSMQSFSNLNKYPNLTVKNQRTEPFLVPHERWFSSCNSHVHFIKITLSEENFDATRWATAAFSNKRSIIGGHVGDNLVNHLNLQRPQKWSGKHGIQEL